MKTLLLSAQDKATPEIAANLIRQGELVAIPTETVYGLGANGLDEAAVTKIFEAKGRPQDNPLILHICGAEQIELFCHDVPAAAYELAKKFWPGPLTMVLPARDCVPRRTTGGLSTVAVRCPDNAVTREIIRLAGVPIAAPSAGCQIARLAVPNMEAARSFADICKDSPLPLVADIHFDYKLTITTTEGGASKIRINPGNIGGEDRVKAVVEVCKDKHIPIRIGVNGGSLDKRLLEKYGHPTAEALVESAFEHLELLEKQGFYDTCVSMKSSTVPTMVAAARLFRAKCDYPLHIGVTETGPVRQGLIKSAMGIGALLLDGIGDTIRVSLTDDPVQEVYAARDILKAAGLRKDGVNIISCPTCGRTRIDLIGLVNRVDKALKNCEKPITVAVMGCVVNGPGEAREADIGIAGGDGWGMIFEKGVQVEKLPYDELLPALLKRIEAL